MIIILTELTLFLIYIFLSYKNYSKIKFWTAIDRKTENKFAGLE